MNTKNEGLSSAPGFCFLDKIYSIKKQLQIFDILQTIRPLHPERLWLAGFLKYVGYSYDEAINIIDQHNEWSDYDADYTAYQVATVYKQPHHEGPTSSKRRVRKWNLTPVEEYRIKLARSAESHRRNEEWMKENNIPIYDACPELSFNPALLGDDGLSKDVTRRWR